MAVNKILVVTNTTHLSGTATSLSIIGDKYRALVPPNSSDSSDLIVVQFDEKFLDDLCNKVDAGLATVTLDGVTLSSSEVGELKYGGSSGAVTDGANIGSGSAVYDGKVASTLNFKGIDAGSSKVGVSSNATDVLVDVNEGNIVHQNLSGAGTNTHAQIDTHIADLAKHREIDDSSTGVTDLWSASKIDSEITGSKRFINPQVVFKETFVGTGAQTTFNLTGAVLNGSFSTGSWAAASIENTYPSHATKTNKKVLYDSANVFSRNRISVVSINAAGLVTLDYAPILGESFYVWYWYQVGPTDVIDDYYREDFIASMEAATSSIAAEVPVDTSSFAGLLSVADNEVQAALDTLDDISHTDLPDIGTYTHPEIDTHIDLNLSIESDIDYYVDGTAGDDSNDGLAWGTAKKTFDFLYSGGTNAIPRIINATVNVYCRGVLRGVTATRHTIINNLSGTGVLNIIGTMTSLETFTITGYDDDATNIDGRMYLDASGASWTTNEHEGHFQKIAASSTYRPISSNTATQLRLNNAPLSPGSTSDIYSATVFSPQQESAPGVDISYSSGNYFIIRDSTLSEINVYNIDFRHATVVVNPVTQDCTQGSISFTSCGMRRLYAFRTLQLLAAYCFVKLIDWNDWVSLSSSSGTFNSCTVDGNGWGYGFYAAQRSYIYVYGSYILNNAEGLSGDGTNFNYVSGSTYFENNDYAIIQNGEPLTLSPWDTSNTTPIRFKNNTTAMHLGGPVLAGIVAPIVHSGNTTEIRLSTNQTETFANMNAQKSISNSSSSASVVYQSGLTYLLTTPDEFDPTISSLTSYTYQNAIDEIYTEIAANTIHRTSDGTDHTYINQDVTSTASPTFVGPSLDYIDFNTSATPTHQTGRMHWSSDYGTVEIGMVGSDVVLQVGQEGLARVRNQSGVAIANGKVVYASGALGDNLKIDLADNTNIDTSLILGVTTEEIAHGADGYVALWGTVRGLALPTGTYTAGDKLYLTTNGDFTLTHPTDATHAVVIVGIVTRAHLTEGEITVMPYSFSFGNEFDGTIRQSIINNSTGVSAATGFTAVNDQSHWMTVGIGGSNNAVFGEAAIFYGPGYADNLYAVDGNKSHKWYNDPTDSHNNSSLSYLNMELNPDGDLILGRGQFESTLVTGTAPLNVASTTLNTNLNADLLDGLHGSQYVTGTDWFQNGFPDRTNSTITFTDGSRTLSIQPVATNFEYFIGGVSYTSTGDTKIIDDIDGMHIVYYDGATLTSLANPTDGQVSTIIRNNATVAYVLWNSTTAEGIYVGEERHGSYMSPVTHAYLHFTEGLRLTYGLGLNTLSVDGTGITVDAQFGVDIGGVSDEDIFLTVSSVAATTGLPIYYMLGSGAVWTRSIEAGFSVRTSDGTSATRLAYNQYTGGAWQLTEVTSNSFVLYHIFATTEIDKPMISIMGQEEYVNVSAARAGAEVEIRSIIVDSNLIPEIRPIATLIFKTNLSYANTVNAKIVSTADGDSYVDWRSEVIDRVAVSTSDHGSLAGLSDDDHVLYALAPSPASSTNLAIVTWDGTSGRQLQDNSTVFITATGQISTGGETSPDVDPGGICLNHGAGTDSVLTTKSSDISHPFTSLANSDTYLEIRKHVQLSGGALIRGFTETTTAFEYRGYAVTSSTGTYATIQLTAYLSDGGTGVTSLSNNSNIVGFRNNGTMKHQFRGGGDAAFVGALTLGSRVGTSQPAGTIQWDGTNFQGYDGAAWNNFGDVFGPASSTDNAVPRFDSTTGTILQDSTIFISDTGQLSSSNMYSGYTIGGTNKDVYVDDAGVIGVVSSSEKTKQNIVSMKDVSWLHDLRPVNFEYKRAPGIPQVGLIAEEVEKIDKQIVTYDKEGKPDGVQYSQLIPLLLKEVQNLRTELDTLKKKNKKLR